MFIHLHGIETLPFLLQQPAFNIIGIKIYILYIIYVLYINHCNLNDSLLKQVKIY